MNFGLIASVASAEQNRKRLASGDKELKASGDRKRLNFKIGSIGSLYPHFGGHLNFGLRD